MFVKKLKSFTPFDLIVCPTLCSNLGEESCLSGEIDPIDCEEVGEGVGTSGEGDGTFTGGLLIERRGWLACLGGT
jgi:hypothetical protein